MSLFGLVDIRHTPTVGGEIPRESHLNANVSEMLNADLLFVFLFVF